MEPFSIFQLLESLFSAKPNQAPSSSNENPPAESTEKPPATEHSVAGGEQANQIEQSSSAQDAVVAFLSAHETRAKRTRR